MPARSTVDKVTRHLRASLATLILLEALAAILLFVFGGFNSNAILVASILLASVSISCWAFRGTKTKNPRLLAMYVGTNLGWFAIVIMTAVFLLVLVLSAEPSEQNSSLLQTVVQPPTAVHPTPGYPVGGLTPENEINTDIAMENPPKGNPMLPLVPNANQVQVVAVMLPNGVAQLAPVNDKDQKDGKKDGKSKKKDKDDDKDQKDKKGKKDKDADENETTVSGSTLGHHHRSGGHHASCAVYMWAGLGIFMGWFSLKMLSIVLAWKLKKSLQGLPFCGSTRCRQPVTPEKEMLSVTQTAPAYAPTPYFVVIPQEGQTYIAPKFSV